MRKHILLLIYRCVLTLALCGTVIHADNLQVTDVDIPSDTPVQSQVEHTVSPVQATETVSTVQDTETVIQATSLKTSLPVDQAESSSINEGTHSPTLVEPSFSETQGTSQTAQSVTESVTQSTSVDQSDVAPESSEPAAGTESKKSVDVPIPEPVEADQADSVSADHTEVKVIEKVADTVTDEAAKETEPSENITQYKVQEKEDEKDQVVTEPSVNVPSAPSGEESRVDGEQPDVGGEMPGVGGETGEVKEQSEEKQEEEGLTFNEWTQKVLAEAEKGKQEAQEDTQNIQLPPAKQRKKKNYASQECGAKILASNPEASSPKSVLNSNKDEYMNNPCKAKKWFVIELCEPIQAHSVDIASLELFSSQPKKFKVFLSDRYPTKDWKLAGEFDLKDERAIQTSTITEAQDYFAKFVRVELLEHYGDEHFCPLTIFRVLGIAVEDYEIDHHDNVDDDSDDDDDENHEGDAQEGSKNLFTSAKDTVINIVKKVLNVESEGEKLIQNASQVEIPGDKDSTSMNGTASSEPNDTLPCVPDANIVADKEGPCTEKKVDGQTEDVLPKAPQPGKTDNVIVVKLEDHEQVETSPDALLGKSLDVHIEDCFLAMFTFARLKKRHNSVHSKLCEFVYMIKQQSPVQQYSEIPLKKKKVGDKVVVDEVSKVATSTDQILLDKEEIRTTVSGDTASVKPANVVSVVTETGSESSGSSSTKSVPVDVTAKSEIVSDSTPVQEKSKLSETAEVTASTISKLIQPTSTENDFASTDTPIVTPTQTVDHVSAKQTGSVTSSVLEPSKSSESEKIEPSPTVVEMPRETTTDTAREATPALSDSWKPDTKDLMQDKTSADTQKASDTTTKQTLKPEPSSVSIPSGETTTAVHTPADDLTQQTGTGDVGLNGGGVDGAQDDLGAADAEVGEDTQQEQKPNTTIIDGKVVVGNGGQQKRENLSLVRQPVIPSSKRESAIMRLNNRIKVLEQNVSLSSRFLEELSRRYKKQSEDMMKMLNKTMATLQNMTVEADVKNKLHEDEMTAMERRLENLTQIVHKLTHSFDSLNRQVTDRQMIWTTIEIVIIVFMLLFLHFRRKKDTLPPEVRSLIESMPSKPATSLPQRRNSLSGPATQSKERTFGNLHSGGGLQRFSSETALVSTDSDFPIVHPIGTSLKQGTDAVKKKKKKKHKNLEGRLSLPASGGPVEWENWSEQTSSHQSASSNNQSKETSQQPFNKSNQSKETSQASVTSGNQSKETSLHSSCNLPQTQSGCFGTLLSGWSNNNTAKQRSASLGTDISTGASSTQVGGTFHQGVQEGTKDCLGTKSLTKGMAKKPPVSGGSKVSPKLNIKIPKGSENEGSARRLEMTLEEKWVKKGHRRQKSLPKQHYSSIETVGHTSHDMTSPAGTQGTVKHFDTTPIPNKVPKKGEMKKSVSLPVSSESNFEKPPQCSYSFANGHSEYGGGIIDTGQTENCCSLETSKSEIYFASKYGKNMYDDFLLNGHTNGDDCNENAYSGDQLTGLGCDRIEYDRTSLEPLVVNNTDSIKARQNGTWKNMFGYFK